jgi:hypothetical protein
MATKKALTGNDQKNNGATFFHANTTEYNDLRFSERGAGSTELAPVSGLTQAAISGGVFANNSEGIYRGYTSQIAGQASSVARFTDRKVDIRRGFRQYERLDVESINALTGVVTYGSNKGDVVLASGIDGTTGVNADHTLSVLPGELVYQKGSINPVQADY